MDMLADMLTRIRNGQRARKDHVRCSASKLRAEVLRVLKEEGYIRDFKRVEEKNGAAELTISLKYYQGSPVIREIEKISKPGRRIYAGVKGIERVYGGLGVAVLSTPRGVMTDAHARSANVGGEILCRVF